MVGGDLGCSELRDLFGLGSYMRGFWGLILGRGGTACACKFSSLSLFFPRYWA